MQRVQVQNAVDADVPAPRDDGAAMAAALHRLAKLRATIYRDWSDGPSSLVAHANVDSAVPLPPSRPRTYAQEPPDLAFTFDPGFTLDAPPALDLRGRFDCLEDMPPPARAEEADPVAIAPGAGAPVAYLLDLVRNLPKAPDVLVRTSVVESAQEEVDDTPMLAVGAVPGLRIVDVEATVPTRAHAEKQSPDETEQSSDAVLAVGAIAGFAAWATGKPTQEAPAAASALDRETPQEEADDVLAVGAFALIEAPRLEEPAPPALAEEPASMTIDEDVQAVGAVAGCLAMEAPALPVESRQTATVEEQTESEDIFACGALNVAPLLALVPEASPFVPPPIVDLEIVALDELLADACDALYAAALDPTENYAWGASVLPGDTGFAAELAACESAFWDLPRIIPCGEAFTLNPNHEIAVQITRALRVRADTLRARAFTEHVNFGALTALEARMPWFPCVDVPVEDGSEVVDADTQLATWGMDDLAAIITAPDRKLPILSEAELDALLSTPAAQDSHELEDDWQECPVWQETFWHDVDAYLQSVEDDDYRHEAATEVNPATADADLEIRDEALTPVATHFWLPGHDADLAISGEGADMFLIGGGDAGVVLVEDGAIHSMRTGRGTRMGEVVVSWSTDAWSDIDSMKWTRVATLSGISQLRVEQTVSHDRMVVVAGDLSGSALSTSCVRLVEATENGPRDFPVMRIGGLEGAAERWDAPTAPEALDHDVRLFV